MQALIFSRQWALPPPPPLTPPLPFSSTAPHTTAYTFYRYNIQTKLSVRIQRARRQQKFSHKYIRITFGSFTFYVLYSSRFEIFAKMMRISLIQVKVLFRFSYLKFDWKKTTYLSKNIILWKGDDNLELETLLQYMIYIYFNKSIVCTGEISNRPTAQNINRLETNFPSRTGKR